MISVNAGIQHRQRGPWTELKVEQDFANTDDALKWCQGLSDQHSAVLFVNISGLDYRLIPSYAGLRWARTVYNRFTQEQLARKADVSARTVGYIEAGRTVPHHETRAALLAVLGIPWYFHHRIFDKGAEPPKDIT